MRGNHGVPVQRLVPLQRLVIINNFLLPTLGCDIQNSGDQRKVNVIKAEKGQKMRRVKKLLRRVFGQQNAGGRHVRWIAVEWVLRRGNMPFRTKPALGFRAIPNVSQINVFWNWEAI